MERLIADLSKMQISQFFAKNPLSTQQECDQEATRITGAPVRPSLLQGGTSYTVVSENVVVQFRSEGHALDIGFLDHIEQAYAGFVPHHVSAGKLGDLHIYTMNNVSGLSMYLARKELQQNDCYLLQQTLEDYARFFTSAWFNTPTSMPCPKREVLLEDYSSQLWKLHRGLPTRFRPTLDYIIPRLPELFADDWPLVPNHIDLLENNIHVDPSNGALMGICDWRDAVISPFGMSLGGLETMLGVPKMKVGWLYHANQQALRTHFWTAFYKIMGDISEKQKERIEVARLVGLFLANGFGFDDNGTKVAAEDGCLDLLFLDAVVLSTNSNAGGPSGST